MKRWIVPVTTVSMIIGALLSVQYRSQADARRLMPSRRVEDLVVLLKSTEKANQQLSDQLIELQGRISQVPTSGGPFERTGVAEYPALTGPGLEVVVRETASESRPDDGTSAVVHAEDLLKIINELRAGGAEAIALNGRRLTEISEVVTAGQHVMVNKVPVSAPFTLVAIGPADDMKNTLGLRGGVVEYLQFYGIEVKTKALKSVEIPAAGSLGPFKFAKPAPPAAPADEDEP